MCLGTHGAEDAAAAAESNFTSTLLAQGKTLFNNAQGVFNTLTNAYTSIVNAGPSQRGYSPAERNALVASTVTGGANAARFANARAGAAVGGGNVPQSSGIGGGAKAAIAQASAAKTASNLNAIEQSDFEQGNKNWQVAGAGLAKAGDLANQTANATAKMAEPIQSGLATNMTNAEVKDAQSNWWVKPAMGAIGAGLNMAVPGLGTAAGTAFGVNAAGGGGGGGLNFGNFSSDSSFMENVGNFFNSGANGGKGTMPNAAPSSGGSMPALQESDFEGGID